MFERTVAPLEKKRANAVRLLIGLLDGSGGPATEQSCDLPFEGSARAQAIEMYASQVAEYEAAIKDLRSLGRFGSKRAA